MLKHFLLTQGFKIGNIHPNKNATSTGVVMYKNGVNTAYFGQSAAVSHRSTKTASASGNQARKRRNWSEVIQGALACLAMAAIFNVILINFLFFPDCNRDNRDCFVVQHLWGAK